MRSRTLISFVAAALLLVGVIAFLAIFARPAAAQSNCGPMTRIAAALASRYGEAPVASGLSGSGAAIVLFATPDGGTFTVLVVRPDGTACGLASGNAWELLEPGPQGEPS